MTWREHPYPYTDEEKISFQLWCLKYAAMVETLTKNNIPFEKTTAYPGGLPDALILTQGLYVIFSDPEKVKSMIADLADAKARYKIE
jgi:hypothetical protein